MNHNCPHTSPLSVQLLKIVWGMSNSVWVATGGWWKIVTGHNAVFNSWWLPWRMVFVPRSLLCLPHRLKTVSQTVDMHNSHSLSILDFHVDGTDHLDDLPASFQFRLKLPGCWNRQPYTITNFELAYRRMLVVHCLLFSGWLNKWVSTRSRSFAILHAIWAW